MERGPLSSSRHVAACPPELSLLIFSDPASEEETEASARGRGPCGQLGGAVA